MKKVTPSHEWIDESSGYVGITSHAQAEMGEIVYVELPQVGEHVTMGDEVVILESTKAATDIATPVSGKVVAVNDQLHLINSDPEGKGWLMQLELSKKEELKKLLSYEQYAQNLPQ